MSKINQYDLNEVSKELDSFKEEVTTIVNFGKYQTPIVVSLPSWSARPGEEVLFRPTSGGTTSYRYLNSAWVSTWSITL